MLVIRLFRTGKKNQPFFKIVVTDKRRPPRGGRFVEDIGFWNPLTKERNLNTERIKYWLSKGAKPSATIHNLLVSEEIIKGKKISKHKPPRKKEKAPEEKKKEPKPELKEKRSEAIKEAKETKEDKAKKEETKEQPEEQKEKKPKEEPKQKKQQETEQKNQEEKS